MGCRDGVESGAGNTGLMVDTLHAYWLHLCPLVTLSAPGPLYTVHNKKMIRENVKNGENEWWHDAMCYEECWAGAAGHQGPREGEMLEIEEREEWVAAVESGEWTTRDQSPSTLFTSQQNLLTDNWFNPPRPFSGNKLNKHLPPVTRSAGTKDTENRISTTQHRWNTRQGEDQGMVVWLWPG